MDGIRASTYLMGMFASDWQPTDTNDFQSFRRHHHRENDRAHKGKPLSAD
jgi:hypothetical protein